MGGRTGSGVRLPGFESLLCPVPSEGPWELSNPLCFSAPAWNPAIAMPTCALLWELPEVVAVKCLEPCLEEL